MNSLIRILGHLPDLTPRETWRLARGRLPFISKGTRWSPRDLLNSVKHRHGIRFAEFLLRQEAIATRAIGWKPLDFEGADVLEVGCGPLAGYGPLAIFRGAKSFVSAEPEWDRALFRDPEIANRYFRVMHADLSALYGPRMSFEDFYRALADRITVHATGFESAQVDAQPDIVLSQSCLEHVFPLEGTVRRLAEVQKPETRFLHLVDFGNHALTQSAFDRLYDRPAADYIAEHGKAINMLRVSDIAEMFFANGIRASIIPSRVISENYEGEIHRWWRERYDDEALFTQLALVASPAE